MLNLSQTWTAMTIMMMKQKVVMRFIQMKLEFKREKQR